MSKESLPRRPRRLTTIWVDDGLPCFFVTICTLERNPVLANEAVHARLVSFLESSRRRYGWCPGRYVIMPDHVHILARGGDDRKSLGAWVKALKAMVGRKEFKWQKGFFDHLVRGGDNLDEKWEYVYQNPVRAGLVERSDQWQFAGEVDA